MLTDYQRQVMDLRGCASMTFPEIGKRLNVNKSSVHRAYTTAKKKLGAKRVRLDFSGFYRGILVP